MSLNRLNSMKNIAPRVRKGDGERRRTASRNDEIGKSMEAANNPEAVGKLAIRHGITEEEVFKRAKDSPNFGQFRMVLGNRMRGVVRRRKADSSLSLNEAAYPTRKARTPGKKKVGKKKVGKKVARKAAPAPR